MNRYVYSLVFSWVNLADAVVLFLSFGLYSTELTMQFAVWYSKRCIEKRAKQLSKARGEV
jgi:hypothetical protein